MKLRSRILVALLAAWLCAVPATARAEFISTAIGLTEIIGTALGISTGVGSVAGAIGGAIIGLGVSAAATVAAKMFAPKTSTGADASQTPTGVQTSLTVGANVPRNAIVGPQATAGQLAYWNLYGENNRYLQLVFTLGVGPHDALTGVIVNGARCTFGTPIAGGTPVTEFDKDVGGSGIVHHMLVRFFNGYYDQAADTELVTNANPLGRWTTDHRGRGVCYVSLTLDYGQPDLWPQGIPQFLFEVQGLRLYDRRKDSANGGSGLHRWDDQHTWEYSDNPALALYTFERGLYVGTRKQIGRGLAPVDLISDLFVAAANISDEDVALKAGGTENRYRIGMNIGADRDWSSVEHDFCISMSGWLMESAGAYGPIAGAAQSPVVTFTDDDLISGREVSYSQKRSRSELVNTIFGTYTDPAQNWQPIPYPARASSVDVAIDGAEFAAQRDYPMVFSLPQVQRAGEIERRLGRHQATAGFTLGFRYSNIEQGDWFTWTSARRDFTKTFIASRITVEDDDSITIAAREISADVFDFDELVDELDPLDPGDLAGVNELVTTVPDFDIEQKQIPGAGGLTIPALHALWSPILDQTVDEVYVEYRIVGTGDVKVSPTFTPFNGEGIISDGVQAGTNYEARANIITTPIRETFWTSWVAVTAPANHVVKSSTTAASASSVPAAGVVGQIVSAQIADAAITAAKLAAAAVTATAFAAGIEPVSIVSSVPGASGYTGPKTVLNTTDGKLYRYAAGAFTVAVPTVDLTGQITTAQMVDLSVTSAKLGNLAVLSTKLGDLAVTTAKLDNLAVTNAKIGDVAATKLTGQVTDAQIAALAAAKVTGQITTTQISDNAISTPKIAAGAVVTASLAADAVTASKIAVTSTSANLVRNGGFEEAPASGTIPPGWTAGLYNTAYNHSGNSSIYMNRASGGTLINSDSSLFPVSEGATYEASIWAARLDGTVAPTITFLLIWYSAAQVFISFDYVNDTAIVGWKKFSLQAVAPANARYANVRIQFDAGGDALQFAADDVVVRRGGGTTFIEDGAVTTGKVFANAITAGKIATDTITANEIASSAIGTLELSALAVTAAKISANTITASQIAADTLTANEIAAGAIATTELGALAVTAGKIATDTITSNEIAANAINTAELNALAVTAAKIAANTITASQIAANTLTAGTIAAGAIGTGQLAAGAVTTTILAADAVTASKIAVTSSAANLTTNGGFEEGATGWSVGTAAGNAHSGNSCLLITRALATDQPNTDSVVFPVSEGDIYEMSGYVTNNTAGTGTVVSLYVLFYSAAFAYLGTGTSNAAINPTVGAWQRLAGQTTAPANARWANIRWQFFSGGDVLSFRVDDTICRRTGGVTFIEDGAITTNKIFAAAITATQIAAGAINASTLIATNVIITGHLVADTATRLESGSDSVTFSANASLNTVCTLPITSSGGKTSVVATVNAGPGAVSGGGDDAATRDVTVYLYIDSTLLTSIVIPGRQVQGTSGKATTRGTGTIQGTTTPSAGSHNFVVKAQSATNLVEAYTVATNIFSLESKR